MNPPPMPTPAQLQAAEKAAPGSAKRLIDNFLEASRRYQDRLDKELAARIEQEYHNRRVRYFAMVCGTFLGVTSLVVCSVGFYLKADMKPYIWILASVSGLAGVFLLGYRPLPYGKTALSPPSPKQTRT